MDSISLWRASSLERVMMSTARCVSINSVMRSKMRRCESREKSSAASFSAASAWAALSSRMAPRMVFSASMFAGSRLQGSDRGWWPYLTSLGRRGAVCCCEDWYQVVETPPHSQIQRRNLRPNDDVWGLGLRFITLWAPKLEAKASSKLTQLPIYSLVDRR